MKKYLKKLFTILGGVTVFVILVVIVVGIVSWLGKERVPGKTILEVNLDRSFTEYVPDDQVTKMMLGRVPNIRDVIEALEKASEDDRVLALIAKIGAADMGMAQIQEIRDAVIAFRNKGKTAIAYADTFSEFGPGNGAYYLATAFDEIYLQPSGDVGLTGLIAETPFIRGVLDKLGIIPRFDSRHEYKNAKDMITERKYTPAHREATEKVIESQFNQIVKGIAERRELSEDDVKLLTDRGPFYGKEALDVKLADAIAYRDEVYAKTKEKAGKDAELLYLSEYLKRAGRPHTKGAVIALIYGVGMVHRGTSGYNMMYGSTVMGSDTVTAAFRAAIDDKNVKAILFRIDSPGGSYVASDSIWRETVRAREAGKPVIVSMGNVAGSGGYFVAMAADKIIAQPSTITGSIGVVGGKMLTSGFWNKIGLSWDEVHTSANANMWTGTHDFTPEQWAHFQSWLDRVYDDFTSKVAQGRNLPIEKVLEMAKGRIWTGEDAKALGLVDEVGGFPLALRLVKEAIGVPEDEKVCLKVFPKGKSFMDFLRGKGSESSEGKTTIVAINRAFKMIQPLLRLIGEIGLNNDDNVLSMQNMETNLK